MAHRARIRNTARHQLVLNQKTSPGLKARAAWQLLSLLRLILKNPYFKKASYDRSHA
jgi:hypothetical protein